MMEYAGRHVSEKVSPDQRIGSRWRFACSSHFEIWQLGFPKACIDHRWLLLKISHRDNGRPLTVPC